MLENLYFYPETRALTTDCILEQGPRIMIQFHVQLVCLFDSSQRLTVNRWSLRVLGVDVLSQIEHGAPSKPPSQQDQRFVESFREANDREMLAKVVLGSFQLISRARLG